jgi:AraC-like DNA-binding protein
MSFHIDAMDFAESERVEMWRDALCAACVPLEVTVLAPQVTGKIDGEMLGAIEIGSFSSVSQTTTRTPRMIDRSEQDYYKLAVPVRGSCFVRQDGRETVLTPGQMTIYDCTRPFDLNFHDSWQMVALVFPRPMLRMPTESTAKLTARGLPGRHGVGALVSALLLSLAQQLEEIPPAAAQHVADSILDLMVTLLSVQNDICPDPGERAYQRSLIMQIKAFVEARLADAHLTPELIASAHYISVRQLYKLFETEGSAPAHYVRERRLTQCSKDLRDPTQQHQPVSTVAARWGFYNISHFNHVFKKAFGESPSDYRMNNRLSPIPTAEF